VAKGGVGLLHDLSGKVEEAASPLVGEGSESPQSLLKEMEKYIAVNRECAVVT
jgi:hypothetical protein